MKDARYLPGNITVVRTVRGWSRDKVMVVRTVGGRSQDSILVVRTVGHWSQDNVLVARTVENRTVAFESTDSEFVTN